MFINKLYEVFPNIVFHIHTEWWVEPNYIALSVFICVVVRKRQRVAAPVASAVTKEYIVGI